MVTLHRQDYTKNKNRYLDTLKTLRKILGENTPIDHVGSTAIPTIEYGKNILDILVGAVDSDDFARLYDRIASLGYHPSQNSKSDIYQFFATNTGETVESDTHIHLVIMGTDRYLDFIRLRDYLLENEDEAIAYSRHKQDLLEKGIADRKEYRATKSKYVEALIDRARAYTNQNK
jgi:GrpB-like predicted nucleotidyltransferase (UPF0157 family)